MKKILRFLCTALMAVVCMSVNAQATSGSCGTNATWEYDADETMTGVEGCYATSFDVKEVTSCLRQALSFKGKTEGRQRIVELGLPMEQVAKKIIAIYNLVLNKQ